MNNQTYIAFTLSEEMSLLVDGNKIARIAVGTELVGAANEI